ncbi:hypothetical protein REJC140_03985 [Pseudorhizobium endolithicum]|uniref:Uncharacterized protein n=1 Tax=Pseudorhizobium endolithicum TaxID=1191678 RepID=A0ABM8PS88_9HYPH|nr:hypothetical protein REJC140_03985 [Pseudorhizobium endolithicum]
MAGAVALADIAQGPVHGLPDEVARVRRVRLDQRQIGEQSFIRLLLFTYGRAGDHREGGAAYIFAFVRGELRDQFRPEGRLREKVGGGVYDFPGIEACRPGTGLLPRQPVRIGSEDRSHAGIAQPSLPELERAFMVALHLTGNRAHLRGRDPERGGGVDAEAGHAGDACLVAERLQMPDDVIRAGAGPERHFSSRASSEDVSQRLPPMDCTSP